MTEVELLVVGAGPGGLCAGTEAARAGVNVLILDENPLPGGQIYRQTPDRFSYASGARHTPEFHRGRELVAEATDAGVRFEIGSTAWGQFEPGVIEVVAHGKPERIRAKRLVIATGAYDRPVPMPGWTLPGVFTVGGAQGLLKSQRILAGRRVLLGGLGPLLLIVASQLADAGAEVVAVSEPVSRFRVIPYLPALISQWRLTRQGLGYRWSLAKRGVPWIAGSLIVGIEGTDRVERAIVARADRDWEIIPGTEQAFDVDVVCLGYGLLPSVELAAICGCPLRFASEVRSWVPVRTETMESGVPGIFIAGDCAGISGAVAAAAEGRIAGLTAARQLGYLAPEHYARRLEPHLAHLRGLERFRRGLDRAYRLKPGLVSLAKSGTIVCRCEEVSLGEIDGAIDDGAEDVNHIKAWTRAGMGPCQGRMCATSVLERLARRSGRAIDTLEWPSPRPPAKPLVPLDSLATLSPPDPPE